MATKNEVKIMKMLLKAGADKVSVNSSAVRRPELINELSQEFGSQCIVVAIDTKMYDGEPRVHTHGGKNQRTLTPFSGQKKLKNVVLVKSY